MTDYRKIWESINGESKSSSVRTQIARKVPSVGVYQVFLATDFIKGIRLLYIKLEPSHEINIDNLPSFRGLEMSITNTSIGEFIDCEFLKFSQTIPRTDNIFESVISDISDKIVQIKNKKHIHATLTKVLNEWKMFFEKQETEILSISTQKGLIGELYFLKDYIFKKYSYTDALLYWTGADRTNHDFQIGDKAIEIKTTSSKQHKKCVISSERQLDSTGVSHLYLSIFAINVHSNMQDKNLPTLIKEIRLLIQDDPIASFQFDIKLAKYGYHESHSSRYTNGFSVNDMKLYNVIDGFPRLLQSNLPEGVGDLKYTIIVAACAPFVIKSEIMELI